MDNLRGAILMVLAMAAFALEDMFFKAATSSIPVGEALVIFGLGGMFAFIGLTKYRGESVLHPAVLSRPILIRSICEVTGRLFFALAIALTPLSSASAVLQATPLVVAVGAIVFFRETVGLHRWGSIIVGFIGVLLILRPGVSGFEPASLFAVIATLGFAGRDLATRAASPALSNVQLGVYGFFMLTVAGFLLLMWSGQVIYPNPVTWMQLTATIGFGVIAYYALTGAMRTGEVSVVAPFRYTRLVFAMALGILVFAERPDNLTLLGGAIVVLSGLYTVIRERKQRR
ncbi:EamA family transporter [Alphaproteobacteria bacterium 46_93_T64]|nr:EamA family transporter [Alphaproteobacteria bacterium 46_93_T64]